MNEVEAEVAHELLWHTQDAEETEWEDETYGVTVRQVQFANGVPLTHLEITRHDREPIHSWRDLQEIKNAICGTERRRSRDLPRC